MAKLSFSNKCLLHAKLKKFLIEFSYCFMVDLLTENSYLKGSVIKPINVCWLVSVFVDDIMIYPFKFVLDIYNELQDNTINMVVFVSSFQSRNKSLAVNILFS